MADTDVHAAVYCAECGGKIKYQCPPDAPTKVRTWALRRAIANHDLTAAHASS